MIATVALLLATAFPSTSRTSWMRPESFHLVVGMSRSDALKAVAIYKPNVVNDEASFDYNDSEGVTLQFRRDRLNAIRFEYFAFLQDARAAFREERAWLQTTFGSPKKTAAKVVIYDNRLPNVMAVLTDDSNSDQGRKGIGMLVVRYYDPVTVREKS
jgi:hypothetical protein